MLEQNLQDQEKVPQQQPQDRLFEDYEIRNWNISTRIYKILGASVLLNLIVILTMGQSNLLTRKGCDSPLVGSVCDVIDTVYFGSKLFGTDTDYIDADYVRTELADADITYIDVSGRELPLTYPAGYFQLANPGQAEVAELGDQPTFPDNIPGFPTTPSGGNLSAQPQVTPTPNKNSVLGDLPDEDDLAQVNTPGPNPPLSSGQPGGKRGSGSKLGGMVKQTPDPTPTPAPGPSADELAEAGKKLNKRPGYDLGYYVLDQLAAPNTKLDLSKTFVIEMNGVLNEEGKLTEKSGIVREEGDEDMKALAKRAIATINDMNLFVFFKTVDVDTFKFTLVQDDKEIYAVIKSDKKNAADARRTVRSMNLALGIAKATNIADDDTTTLLNRSSVTQEGKFLVMKFALPKEDAQLLIKRQLQKAALRREEEKKAQEKAAGGASPSPAGNSAAVK